ncbi:hypothetical protein OHS81_12675 [Streptomyces sp. NBC_00400]
MRRLGRLCALLVPAALVWAAAAVDHAWLPPPAGTTPPAEGW